MPQEAPSPDLWDRIARTLDGPAPVRAVRPARTPWFTRIWAVGSTAVAAGLVVLMVVSL